MTNMIETYPDLVPHMEQVEYVPCIYGVEVLKS